MIRLAEFGQEITPEAGLSIGGSRGKPNKCVISKDWPAFYEWVTHNISCLDSSISNFSVSDESILFESTLLEQPALSPVQPSATVAGPARAEIILTAVAAPVDQTTDSNVSAVDAAADQSTDSDMSVVTAGGQTPDQSNCTAVDLPGAPDERQISYIEARMIERLAAFDSKMAALTGKFEKEMEARLRIQADELTRAHTAAMEERTRAMEERARAHTAAMQQFKSKMLAQLGNLVADLATQ